MNAIQPLIELQEIDDQIRELEREEKDIPRRQAQERARLAGVNASLASAKEELDALRARIKQAEDDIAERREKVRQMKIKQTSLKTNREYEACSMQITGIEQEIESLIARQIAIWMKLSPEDVDVVTLAGIYHDIGKLRVPPEVLTKKEKLSDEEFQMVRNHPQYSYNILKKQNIDNRIKKAALQHHERSDGNGYPMGLVEDEIEDFSCLIALADVYEAMTAKRSYRAPLSPFQVIGEFEKTGLGVYKTEFLLTFLKQIAKTYQNNRVLLNNGNSANIILLNDKKLSKPVVQLNDGSCIDLSRSDLYIQALI